MNAMIERNSFFLLSLTETFEVKDFLRFLAICGLEGHRMGRE
jgi:hypothetical protein